MDSSKNEKCFCRRSDEIKDFPGFALDIGSSQAKLVYLDPTAKHEKNYRILNTKTFPRDDITSLIQFIKNNCNWVGADTTHDVRGTGYGVFTHKTVFEKELNIRLKVLTEFDCVAHALVTSLQNYPIKDVFYMRNSKSEQVAFGVMKEWADTLFANMSLEENNENTSEASSSTKPPSATDQHQSGDDSSKQEDPRKMINNVVDFPELESDSHFPCLVAVLGSGFALYMVTADGKYQVLDGSILGGRSFVGLSNLLLGTTDFDELMSLAEKGDHSGVNSVGADLKKQFYNTGGKLDAEAKVYLTFPDNQVLFSFGKAAESNGPFKKEDLADALWKMFVYHTIQASHLVANQHGFKRIFFSGGVIQSDYARFSLEAEMISRLSMHPDQSGKKTLYGFLQNGEMFGALGALLLSSQK